MELGYIRRTGDDGVRNASDPCSELAPSQGHEWRAARPKVSRVAYPLVWDQLKLLCVDRHTLKLAFRIRHK